jgi:anionic cell wall polymer biosynthesis LytR-Cps2A-Psr (LCP) family protein
MHGRRSARPDRVLTRREAPGGPYPPYPPYPPPYYEPQRRRRSIPARLAATVLIILALLALYGLGALFYASRRITREPVQGLDRGRVYHVLVTGSDSRERLSDEQRNELNTGSAGGERTDTIFVLSIQGSKAAMLAFPRDLWVTRCVGTEGRINASTCRGVRGCLV